jgi:hypothetical protein
MTSQPVTLAGLAFSQPVAVFLVAAIHPPRNSGASHASPGRGTMYTGCLFVAAVSTPIYTEICDDIGGASSEPFSISRPSDAAQFRIRTSTLFVLPSLPCRLRLDRRGLHIG